MSHFVFMAITILALCVGIYAAYQSGGSISFSNVKTDPDTGKATCTCQAQQTAAYSFSVAIVCAVLSCFFHGEHRDNIRHGELKKLLEEAKTK